MKKIKVLLVIPPFPARTYPGKTVGPDYIANVLIKNKYQVEILDLDVVGLKELTKELKKDYDLIGISFLSFQTDSAMNIAKKCDKFLKKVGRRDKKSKKYVPIITGGVGSSYCKEIIDLYPIIDAFCIEESFKTIIDIVKQVEKGILLKNRDKIKGIRYYCEKEKKVIETSKKLLSRNVDNFIPKRLHHHKKYDFTEIFGNRKTAQMITQFGCPNCCVFCGESVKGPLVRKRSLKSIKSEIDNIIKDGYRAIYFDDSTFTYFKKRTIKLVKLLREYHKKYNLVWGFNTRVDALDEQLIKLIKESGCVYMFAGVETLVPEIVNGMNKFIPNINKDYPPLIKTAEQYIKRAEKVYKIMEKYELTKSCFLIFGGPKKVTRNGKIKIELERFKDVKKTIDAAVLDLKPEFISINILRFIPNAIMSFAKNYSVLRGQKEPFTGGYFSTKYRKKNKIKKMSFRHPIYLAFEAASDFYPIPPHMSPKYCYKILSYLLKKVNEYNKSSNKKIKVWVDKEFKKYMPLDKKGVYHLLPLSKIKDLPRHKILKHYKPDWGL